MSNDAAFQKRTAAVPSTGRGTGREVLVNTSIKSGIFLGETPTLDIMQRMIAGFEADMYLALKTLLKTRRGNFIIDRGNMADADQPFYFTGHWTSGDLVKDGERRFAFSIASTKVLRRAAGLESTGPRSPDYKAYPNEKLLQLPWSEKLEIIDRALGPDWKSLQAAIKPSAHDFGVVLPDLQGMLAECGHAYRFLKQVLEAARPQNITGEVRRGQKQYLLWCFIAYLRQRHMLLLPLCAYYVQFWAPVHGRFDNDVVFSPKQREALLRLWEAAENYEVQNRLRIVRIAQAVFLSSDIRKIGDISPESFMMIGEALMDGLGASASYRSKFLDLAHSTYDMLASIWNDDDPDQRIVQPAGSVFRKAERSRPASQSSRRREDPFWFAEVPADKWHRGHPISGYTPNEAVRSWAAILRQAFPHIKVKDPSRFRAAGLHWLSYINSLDAPPIRIEEVVRSRHINDLVSASEGTFRRWLANSSLSPNIRNDILSSLAQMFSIYLRVHGLEVRNPIEFDLDRFLAPQPRGKTPRTPLSPEMLLYLKEFNKRDDFAFSRRLTPMSWTAEKALYLRHYRRIVDPEDGEIKMIWWPSLAVLLDLMLTIPLRGFQARWLDTGEGDESILDLETLQDGPNLLPTARKGRQMGVFTSFAKGLDTSERILGLRITTNKRAVECDGRYGIPYCPDDLRDSIAMLVAWQRRYNPVSKPVRAERDQWVTQFRSEEVTALIPEVFALFRDPVSEDGFPPTYQQVQTYWNLLCVAAEDELHESRGTKFRLTRDRSRESQGSTLNERVALFDLHSLRVSGITALIEKGLPPHFVQEIVGHAAIVMTLYYHKIHPGQINRALSDAFESRELSLERIPELLADLDGYDEFLLNSRPSEDALGRDMLRSAIGNGTYQVLSHGICPGGDCRTGGEYNHLMKEHDSVARAGACALCRYRLTGPMFLAGLVVNANKIMAEMHTKGQEIARLNDEVRLRRRENRPVHSFEARRELLYRELEDLWGEWAAEHQYVQDSARLLSDYLRHRTKGGNLPILAAEGALAELSVRAERRHPFHLKQLLAQASAYVPSDRHSQAIAERDAFLNELLANNDIDPFLLRLPRETRLEAANLLGGMLAEMVPDEDLDALHDGLLPLAAISGLEDGIRALAGSGSTSLTLQMVASERAALPEAVE